MKYLIIIFAVFSISFRANALVVIENTNLADPIEINLSTTIDLIFTPLATNITRELIFLELFFGGNVIAPNEGFTYFYSTGVGSIGGAVFSISDPIDYLKIDISDIFIDSDTAQMTLNPSGNGVNISNVLLSGIYALHVPLPGASLLFISAISAVQLLKLLTSQSTRTRYRSLGV